MTTATTSPEATTAPEDLDSAPVGHAEPWREVRASVTLDTLPERDLDKRELLELACSVAGNSDLWRQHVVFDGDQRHYVSLHRDAHVDVWVLCWTPQSDTGWHDHDISSGAVAVAEGTLVEHNLAVDVPSLATEVPAGQVYSFGPDHIHRLTGRDPGSVSIHAYSPPLWRMGQYAVSRTGILRRTSVSYADELRPLDDMA
ncbi:cysteine dioxygenase family protein [Streptomyces sp. NPDC051976]|uniref:cysteine dioxygenase n=1 Tax=Streptomyces sp. NPDC051976 TaxID=3154947 RepID=UPI00341C1D36